MANTTVLKERVLVLLSGGIDSAVCATLLHNEGKSICALSVRYPDRTNEQEINNAINLSQKLGFDHVIADFSFVKSLMINPPANMTFNVGGSIGCVSLGGITMPMSVELLHVVAMMFARINKIKHIYWAIHQDDLLGDIKEKVNEYLHVLNHFPTLDSYSQCQFHLPFAGYSKKEVVELGVSLGVDFDKTRSCSSPGDGHCGVCRQCVLRTHAFDESLSLKQG